MQSFLHEYRIYFNNENKFELETFHQTKIYLFSNKFKATVKNVTTYAGTDKTGNFLQNITPKFTNECTQTTQENVCKAKGTMHTQKKSTFNSFRHTAKHKIPSTLSLRHNRNR